MWLRLNFNNVDKYFIDININDSSKLEAVSLQAEGIGPRGQFTKKCSRSSSSAKLQSASHILIEVWSDSDFSQLK